MILSSIYIKIGDSHVDVDYAYNFKKQSRCLDNFIQRTILKNIKFKTDSFNRVVISANSQSINNKLAILSTNVLSIGMPFDKEDYEGKVGKDLNEFYGKLMVQGFLTAVKDYVLPVIEIRNGISSFFERGMVNEWCHQKKLAPDRKHLFELNCYLTQDYFQLFVDCSIGGVKFFSEKLLNLDPDEIAFGYRFRSIEFEDGQVIITSKTSNHLWKKDLTSIYESSSKK